MIKKGILQTRDGFTIWCLGGAGSGNFDHGGIPGQRGGSASGTGGGADTIREGKSLKTPNEADFNQKTAVAAIMKEMNPNNNSSIEIADIYNTTAGTKFKFEEIQNAQNDFAKEIRSVKKDPSKLVVKLEDLVVGNSGNPASRAVAGEFAQAYANRRGVNVNFNTKDIVSGQVTHAAFDPFYD